MTKNTKWALSPRNQGEQLLSIMIRSGVAFSAALAIALLTGPVGKAAISTVSGGVSIVAPMGNAYTTFGQGTSYRLEVADHEASFSQYFDILLTGEFLPLTVRNTNGPTVKLNSWGFYGGLQYQVPTDTAPILPFMGIQIGTAFNTLSFPGASNITTNQTFSFASRVSPGIAVPVIGGFSFSLATPIEIIFVKNTLLLWNGSFSLRYKL